MHPRIFIGSSTEAKSCAVAIQANLQGSPSWCECTVWDQAGFPFTQSILDGLLAATQAYDFAIFVLSNDDILRIRDQTLGVTRDNVIFELGLFMGALGRDRVFILKEDRGGGDLRIPSDILGIKTGVFSSERGDKNLRAALGPTAEDIRNHILDIGVRRQEKLLMKDGSFVDHVAAVCYKIEGAVIKFLIVKTTEGRSIFPKGRIRGDETLQAAALKYAWSEGGCRGRVVGKEPYVFRYYKEELRQEFPVAAVIVQVEHHITARHQFRDPVWCDFNEAKERLAEKRQWEWGKNLIDTLQECEFVIRQLSAPRYQAGAIPYRMTESGPLVLLVTSRTSKSWILPKGNIGAGCTPADAAQREALEEAGVAGRVAKSPAGRYQYTRLEVEYFVEMFDLEVTEDVQGWPERDLRERKWMRPKDAINLVEYEHVKEALFDFERRMSSSKGHKDWKKRFKIKHRKSPKGGD
jgi:8-oxo-dGTP pyrophosphatase MutT (NUDIX family)